MAADLFMTEAGGEIVWSPTKAFGSATLVVSGPDGYLVERSFAEGETPSLSLFDGAHEAVDGGYTWSLIVVSKLSDSLKAEMEAARAAGDEDFIRNLKAQGIFSSQSHEGHFAMVSGQLIIPELSDVVESDSDVAAASKALPTKAQVINEDLIVDGSACVGTDCTSGESFGFDTIRMKENNTRLKFIDTSSSGSFPTTDWELIANDSNNGGAEKFVIKDVTDSKNIFTLEGGARNNALYVENDGDVGIGTNSPTVNLHIKEGDTPTLRLEQDTSSGFTAQTYDIFANDANFAIRDVTNSSALTLRMRPGAPSNSIYVAADGDIGLGHAGPSAQLHVKNSDGDTAFEVEETNSTETQRILMNLENNGFVSFQLTDSSSDQSWVFTNKESNFEISKVGSGASELLLNDDGDLTIRGELTTAGDTYPDYVFKDGYELMSLDDVEAFIEANGHLPNVKSEADVEYGKRINMTELSISLLEKVEELTLYTIDQHKTIQALEERLAALEAERK